MSRAGDRPLVVVGDALLDVDLVGTASRLTPDAPVPVVEDVETRERPGGAALAAVIAGGLGRTGGRAGRADGVATRAPSGCGPCSTGGCG